MGIEREKNNYNETILRRFYFFFSNSDWVWSDDFHQWNESHWKKKEVKTLFGSKGNCCCLFLTIVSIFKCNSIETIKITNNEMQRWRFQSCWFIAWPVDLALSHYTHFVSFCFCPKNENDSLHFVIRVHRRQRNVRYDTKSQIIILSISSLTTRTLVQIHWFATN